MCIDGRRKALAVVEYMHVVVVVVAVVVVVSVVVVVVVVVCGQCSASDVYLHCPSD